MKADDVVVLEKDGQGERGEHYLVGKLRQAVEPHPPDTPLWLDVVDQDRDRFTAFEKARALAAGRDVFFTLRGQLGWLQDHYNTIACPKCGMYSSGFEVVALRNGAQSMRCHACKHPIEITIIEP